ncbi:MAG: histone deacetylase family protein [Deltaproteobacteria bacterium]|nr:histone deacetylase family protein [Deltaproteobacteria bacterium]
MKVIFHTDFYVVYASEPAAAPGRMEAVVECLGNRFDMLPAVAADPKDIEAVHSTKHIARIRQQGLYDIAALAAGGAVQAATIGLKEPAFALIRPPGHHASQDSSWGFCYFNNMAVALTHLLRTGRINTAAVLDFDLHYGDGTENILSGAGVVEMLNPGTHARGESGRKAYLGEVESFLKELRVDIIGISAGFDNHELDWGGLLSTEDYFVMGRMVKERALEMGAGCFGLLEGGYNHCVLGQNVLALIEGISG